MVSVMQALIARGVTPDFRAPDILRFGILPLYTSFEDIWNAVQHLRHVMRGSEWNAKQFQTRNKVT